MSDLFTVRRAIVVAGLAATWCGLWRDVSMANVLVGAVLAAVLTSGSLRTSARRSVRFRPLARFALLVFIDLAKSTVGVAHEILTPTDYTEEAVIAVRLPPESSHHLLLLTVAITLTPGTAVVEADTESDPDSCTLYLHVLHHSGHEAVVAHAHELARLACNGLPTHHGVPS